MDFLDPPRKTDAGAAAPQDLLARTSVLKSVALVGLVALVAFPILPLWVVLGWSALYLLATAVDRRLLGRAGGRANAALAFIITFGVASLTAAMAQALIAFGDGGARFFAVALISLSTVKVLLRFYQSPKQFLAAISPHLLVLGVTCWNISMRHLEAGDPIRALTPPAVLVIYALLMIPMRAKLADAWKRLEAAKSTAEQASQAKSEFLATMSHEIRTPLNGVLGMAQAMEADGLPPAQKEKLRVIRRSGETLLSILNDVLDLSKIEEGQLSLESAEFDMEHCVRGAAATFAPLAEKKGLTFEFSIADEAKGRFLGDSVRLRQILYNLVSNAVKFTESGGVAVGVSYAEGRLRIEVADSGAGIAKDRIEQLFETFVQGDSSTTRRHGGSGLGLSICRRLADLMGGSISASSVEGKGSIFVVSLPIARLSAPAPPPSAIVAEVPQEAPPIRILAAEDNPVNQLVLKTLLSQAGLEPTVVENGAEAVEAWRTGSWDVILMDIQMPVMDGVAATRQIRAGEAAERRARTPIIAVTANAMTHQVGEYAAAGMDLVVPKPLDAARLFEAMEQVLSESEPAEAVAA